MIFIIIMEPNDTLVLVTGATGFIAGYCIKILLEQGFRVRGTVQSLSNTAKYQHLFDLENGKYKNQLEFVQLNLLNEKQWDEATKGCTYVLHIASPIPPKDILERQIVEPAINGTKFAMHAAINNKVKRIVITSSTVACVPPNVRSLEKITESHFTAPTEVGYYRRSKIMAELEAWNIYKANKDKIELAVIVPGCVMGRSLTKTFYASASFVKAMMNREYPSLPQFKEGIVHIKDIAEAHVRAMIIPEANGQRFIIVQGTYFIRYIAEILNKEYESKGYKIVKSNMSYLLFFFACFTASYLKGAKEIWKHDFIYDNQKSKDILKMSYAPAETAILETAEWLIDCGHVKKKN